MPDWLAARAAMMLDPSVTNLNTGSFGPTPKPVFDRVTELRRHLAAEPWNFLFRELPPLLWTARNRLAQFLGTQPTRLVFTQNVSTAINIIAAGLSLKRPGSILLSDREYQAMHWVWERAAKTQGLELRTFPLPLMPKSPDDICSIVEKHLDKDVRLFFFSHVYSATGIIVPAKRLCDLARSRGIISVVDGAHAPGMIDLNIDEVDADFYCGNCHKWLLAPIGAGFLSLGRNSLDRLAPLQVSWGFHRDPKRGLDEPDEFGSTPRTRQLEFEGTRDVCPWLAVPDAIDFQAEWGFDAIRHRIAELQSYLRQRLDVILRLRRTTPHDPRMHGSMTAYWMPENGPADDVRRQLWDRRIEVPITEWPDGRMFRVSTHFYTTEEEIEKLVEFFD